MGLTHPPALLQEHGIPIIRVTREKDQGGESNPKSSNLNNCLRQIYGDSVPPASEVGPLACFCLKRLCFQCARAQIATSDQIHTAAVRDTAAQQW